jgi:3alpha(or 20beta)-hydroxysteroid dehydrogenase
MNRLEGRTAIITGGASGIGAASARLFVEEGRETKLCRPGL